MNSRKAALCVLFVLGGFVAVRLDVYASAIHPLLGVIAAPIVGALTGWIIGTSWD